MIALVTSFFLIFYILIPGALFRFATSFSSIKLKSFQRTRTQEATFAVAVALLPFALALLGVWYMPVMRHQPFAIREGTNASRRQDYRRVGELILTGDLPKLTGCVSSPAEAPCAAANPYWSSLTQVLRRQARFLCWYYLVIVAEGWAFGFLAGKYGAWQRTPKNRHRLAIRLYDWFTRKFILPNISEWHVLLTGFNWPRGVLVIADVLQNDGHLYRGRVEDYFVDPDGKLTGILLRNVERFDLHAYRLAQDAAATNREIIASENYWKTIPSKNFYIGQTAITNLNIRFAPGESKALGELTQQVLSQAAIRGAVSIESIDSRRNDGQPDLYS
jgi:hypothetical protein